MAIEVGSKVTGKVSGITNFGAFVDLDDNQTGLVHISQISDRFIKDIHDVLEVGDEVTVKVTKVGDDGKIALSMKQAQEHHGEADHHHHDRGHREQRDYHGQNHHDGGHYNHQGGYHGNHQNYHHSNNGGHGHHGKQQNGDFNDMLASYLKESESRLSSLKRQTDGKRGGRGGRRS